MCSVCYLTQRAIETAIMHGDFRAQTKASSLLPTENRTRYSLSKQEGRFVTSWQSGRYLDFHSFVLTGFDRFSDASRASACRDSNKARTARSRGDLDSANSIFRYGDFRLRERKARSLHRVRISIAASLRYGYPARRVCTRAYMTGEL